MLGTNRLCGFGLGIKRAVPAALLGAIYAGACLLPGFRFLGNLLWRLVSLTLMSIIAFGLSDSALRRGILFILLSMALGGIAVLLDGDDFWALVLSALAVCFMCVMGFRGKAGQQRYVSVTICYGGKRAEVTALVDTGNTLRDPLSGRPVLVVDETVAAKLAGFTSQQLSHPVETLASGTFSGLRLIPYTAIGNTAGMLLGVRPDSIVIDGKESEYMVAFAPQRLGQGRYQALAGGAL